MLGMPLYARTDEWDAHAVVVMRLSAYMKGELHRSHEPNVPDQCCEHDYMF